jgi:hypothetical protein
MQHLPARLFTCLIVSAALAASPARADFMNWSYSTSAVPPGFAVTGANNEGSGAVQLTPFSNATGGQVIPVLAYVTSATVPVTFDPQKSTYTLNMTITDNTTKDSGNLSFTGSIGGGLTPTSSTLTNTFSVAQKSLTLDGHVYTVTLPASDPLLNPLTPQRVIIAGVRVSNAVASAPEPASLLLGGLGFTALGIGSWWRRLRRPEPRPA